MKFTILFLLTLAGSASAVEITLKPNVDKRGCDHAAAKNVEGQTNEDGSAKAVPTCAAYLKALLEGASADWAKGADDAAIDAARQDPARRQRLVTEATR